MKNVIVRIQSISYVGFNLFDSGIQSALGTKVLSSKIKFLNHHIAHRVRRKKEILFSTNNVSSCMLSSREATEAVARVVKISTFSWLVSKTSSAIDLTAQQYPKL